MAYLRKGMGTANRHAEGHSTISIPIKSFGLDMFIRFRNMSEKRADHCTQ